MKYLYTLFLTIFFFSFCHGQKFLQLEKTHSPKTKKYAPGSEITFQVVGGQWYERVLEDISYEQKLLIFPKGHMHVDSIIAFRTFDDQRWSRPIGNQMINFAAVWTIYSTIDAALSSNFVDEISRPFVYTTPAFSAGLGLLIKQIFKQRTYKMKKNKNGEPKKFRLRVIDLEVKRGDVNGGG